MDAMKTQKKINSLSDENSLSEHNNSDVLGADIEQSSKSAVQQQQQLNEASTISTATACS